MSRVAQALPVSLPAPTTGADSRRHLPAAAARVSAPLAIGRAADPGRRLRLVLRTSARPVDRSALAALLLDLDQRRRRAQIAARHALGI